MGVLTGVLFVLAVLLSCFFDAMGTVLGVAEEGHLLDPRGNLPGMNRVLMIDGIATLTGGATSSSAGTCSAESTTGVGMASIVTGLFFAAALFLTPLAMVP